jgi:hypothetical protein
MYISTYINLATIYMQLLKHFIKSPFPSYHYSPLAALENDSIWYPTEECGIKPKPTPNLPIGKPTARSKVVRLALSVTVDDFICVVLYEPPTANVVNFHN